MRPASPADVKIPTDFGALHKRLAEGDTSVITELAEALVAILRPRIRRWCPAADPHDVGTAIDDAVMKYLRHPELFHPAGAPLDFWLSTAVLNRVKDLKRSSRRFVRRALSIGVDLDLFAAPLQPDPEPHLTLEECRRRILSVATKPAEVAFVKVRLNDGDIVEQAKAICGQALDLEEARTVVNRMVNKLHKRGERAGSSSAIAIWLGLQKLGDWLGWEGLL